MRNGKSKSKKAERFTGKTLRKFFGRIKSKIDAQKMKDESRNM